jgi:hypothetical protein
MNAVHYTLEQYSVADRQRVEAYKELYIAQLDVFEKLRIYMHYYIEQRSIFYRYGPVYPPLSFGDFISKKVIDRWFIDYKETDFAHKSTPISEFTEKQKPVVKLESDEEKFPELKGRKYTKYPYDRFPFAGKNSESYERASKKFLEEFRKGDEEIHAWDALYRIHREDAWRFKYYKREVWLFFWRPYFRCLSWFIRTGKALMQGVKNITAKAKHKMSKAPSRKIVWDQSFTEWSKWGSWREDVSFLGVKFYKYSLSNENGKFKSYRLRK